MKKVVFAFDASAMAELAELSKGQEIVIEGRVKGFTMGLILDLADCRILK